MQQTKPSPGLDSRQERARSRQKPRKFSKTLLTTLAPLLAAPLLYILSRTWRVEITGNEDGYQHLEPKDAPACIFGLWHSDDLTLGSLYSYRRVGIIISLSSDGELIARTLRYLGFEVFRGSSSRSGARGLLGLIRHVRAGAQACLTVDGPRGPLHKVKPGVVEVAAKTGTPVIPIGTFASRAWRFPKTWNKTYIPKPFATVTVMCNAPVFCEDDAASRAACLKQVQAGLEEIGRIARERGLPGA